MKAFLPALLASTFLCLPGLASAQSPSGSGETASSDAGSEGLADIIVTAQRRSERMQNVPISISALSGDQISKLGVVQPDGLAQLVPSLQLNQSVFTVTPFLRGVGSTASIIGNEPAVAMFVDDVYVPSGTGAVFRLNSIASVEVLKGPQGTLFGRNATGGVLHIHTKDPSFDPTASVVASYGNYDTISGQIYASTGLNDKIAINIAAQAVDQRKGWGINAPTGDENFKMAAWGVRGKLLWDMDDKTSLLISGNYDRLKSGQGQLGRSIKGTVSRDGYSADAAGLGFYDTMLSLPSYYISRSKGVSAKLSRDMGSAKLLSITAFSKTDVDPFVTDGDGTPTVFFEGSVGLSGRSFTQEVQLLSPDDSAIKWILGAFYFHDRSTYGFQDAYGAAFGTAHVTTHAVQTTNSISGFGQITAEIMPKTNLTMGLRYTSDHRTFNAVANRLTPPSTVTTFGPFHDSKTFNSVTGRASLDYHFTDNVMGYLAYNRGFKSGVYNLTGVSAGTTTVPPAVNPEVLDAYSAGIKSELFDRRLRLNAEAYYYKYSNLQVSVILPTGGQLANAAKATIKGIEFEMEAAPFRNLKLNASIGITDGKYDMFKNAPAFFLLPPNAPTPYDPNKCTGPNPYPAVAGAAPATQRACDVSGGKMVQTPPFTSNFQVIYTIPSDVGEFSFSSSWAHGGNYNFDVFNSPLTKQPITNIVNSSIEWRSVNGQFTARIWSNNLTKQKYYLNATTGSTGGAKYAPAAPRTYGVTLGAHF